MVLLLERGVWSVVSRGLADATCQTTTNSAPTDYRDNLDFPDDLAPYSNT